MKFVLKHVYYMPKELESNTLYVSDEFDIAMHLCACNCGIVVKTPLGPAEWSVRETANGPTLRPSVGNWQQCQSHYFITDGEIEWCEKWSEAEIAAGRRNEQGRREAYYDVLNQKRSHWVHRLWNRLLDFMGF